MFFQNLKSQNPMPLPRFPSSSLSLSPFRFLFTLSFSPFIHSEHIIFTESRWVIQDKDEDALDLENFDGDLRLRHHVGEVDSEDEEDNTEHRLVRTGLRINSFDVEALEVPGAAHRTTTSCSLLLIDRGNRAIREIQLHFDDCAYQYGSGFPLGIAMLVGAGFFGYMLLALLQCRLGTIVASQEALASLYRFTSMDINKIYLLLQSWAVLSQWLGLGKGGLRMAPEEALGKVIQVEHKIQSGSHLLDVKLVQVPKCCLCLGNIGLLLLSAYHSRY